MMRPRVIAAIAAVVLAAGAAPVALGAWNPLAASYAQGVDVSAHQGLVDWTALARAHVRFAYVKATEGSDYVDPRFLDNWRSAANAGLYRGAYHYFTLCRSGALQAGNFIRSVPNDPRALPPAVDLEHMGPCRRGPTAVNVDAEVRTFLDIVEAHYGRRPILYTTREFHDAHLADFPHERFWIRSLYTPPAFRAREWVLWQHHNGARRPGVATPVDLDAFRGDDAALARFAHATGPTT
jgi:lysozyme